MHKKTGTTLRRPWKLRFELFQPIRNSVVFLSSNAAGPKQFLRTAERREELQQADAGTKIAHTLSQLIQPADHNSCGLRSGKSRSGFFVWSGTAESGSTSPA